MKKILILAGGFGSRLRSAVYDVPKPLAPVCGKPFLVYLIENLIAHNTYESDGVKFDLKRSYNDGFITKNIEVNDAGTSFHFEEKVRAFNFQDFETMLSNAGLHLIDCFGNYQLEPFDSKTSERLILIFMAND